MRIEWRKEEPKPAERSLESYTEKEKWASLSTKKRIRYLWDYYKLHFFIVFLILYIIGFNIYRQVTHKDTLLFSALINFAPSEEISKQLSEDYLTYINANTRKEQFKLYSGWYLTADKDSPYYEYNFASQMKILAAIDDEQLDVILLDRESFDAFSQNGYLYNIEELLRESSVYDKAKPYIISNIVFLEDNAKDINFDATIEFVAETAEFPMGLDITNCSILSDQQYSDTVYLAVIANTPRKEEVTRYLEYLFAE